MGKGARWLTMTSRLLVRWLGKVSLSIISWLRTVICRVNLHLTGGFVSQEDKKTSVTI